MAVVFEVLSGKQEYKNTKIKKVKPDSVSLLLALAFITSFLFWGVGLTSFWASTIAIMIVSLAMFYYRTDLLINGLISGVSMALISSIFYLTILAISPNWVSESYMFETLSGKLVFGVPIEEFVFWFLAGLFSGPLYEYWQDKRLRKIR